MLVDDVSTANRTSIHFQTIAMLTNGLRFLSLCVLPGHELKICKVCARTHPYTFLYDP